MRPFRLAAAAVLLALPSAASAATVSPGQSIQKAVDAASNGDVIDIQAGVYREVVSTDKTLTLRAQPGTFLANPDSVSSGPTLSFTGSGGDTVTGIVVVSTVGDAVQVGGGTTLIQRSGLITLAKGAAALSATAGSQAGAASAVTVDSAVLVGALSVAARYASPATLLGKGISFAGRHVTAIGDVVADASTAAPGSTGIAVGFLDSIVRGKRTATTGQGSTTALPTDQLPALPGGLPLPLPTLPADPLAATAATITVDPARNDVKDTASDAGSLFVRPAAFDLHLRADAPVIDKGQVTSGELATDIDGEPRASGAASDYGADEFVNKAPRAVITATVPHVRQNVPVTFSAARSTDPEANSGGGIKAYHWAFGDGSTADTAGPTVSHAFAEKKAYSVTVSVTDRQGLSSGPSAPVGFTVIDGTPPTLAVNQPAAGQRIPLYKKARKGKRPARARVVLFGSAHDDTALGRVYLVLRSAKQTADGSCRWFDGKRKLVTRSCAEPVLLGPALDNGSWRYALPGKARLARGAYTLIAVAVDASGLASPRQTVDFRFR